MNRRPRRTTQIRARFPEGSNRLHVFWDVTDPAPTTELIDDAQPELADELVARHLDAVAVRWFEVHGEGVTLHADVLVKPHPPTPGAAT